MAGHDYGATVSAGGGTTGAPTATTLRRVVIADNDADALELAVLDLQLEGHEVVGTALEGDTALALVEQLVPDVVVLDHRMPPGPWGMDVAARIRAERPGVEVIVYSNYQSVELLERARQLGVRFLPKGNLRTLRRAVSGR